MGQDNYQLDNFALLLTSRCLRHLSPVEMACRSDSAVMNSVWLDDDRFFLAGGRVDS